MTQAEVYVGVVPECGLAVLSVGEHRPAGDTVFKLQAPAQFQIGQGAVSLSVQVFVFQCLFLPPCR